MKRVMLILLSFLKVVILLLLTLLGVLYIGLANDEFEMGLGNSALTHVVTMPLYVQILALVLLIVSFGYFIFSKIRPFRTIIFRFGIFVVTLLLFINSQHLVCNSARKARVTDVWMLLHTQPINYHKAEGPIGFTYNVTPFTLTIENPEGERAVIFLGVYPFRLDSKKIIKMIE